MKKNFWREEIHIRREIENREKSFLLQKNGILWAKIGRGPTNLRSWVSPLPNRCPRKNYPVSLQAFASLQKEPLISQREMWRTSPAMMISLKIQKEEKSWMKTFENLNVLHQVPGLCFAAVGFSGSASSSLELEVSGVFFWATTGFTADTVLAGKKTPTWTRVKKFYFYPSNQAIKREHHTWVVRNFKFRFSTEWIS